MLTPPPEARCLIFDWDGTLADTQHANYLAMAEALRGFGVELDQSWFDERTGLSSGELVETLMKETAIAGPVPVAEVVRARDAAFLRGCHRIREVPAVAEVMRTYHGSVPVAVASGGARQVIEATIPHVGLSEKIDVLVTREDVERGKPWPDLFLLAARRLGVSPGDCLVYEDSDEGLLAAEAAGMAAIDVRPYRAGSAS
ncbi:HAD family phosphatase [Streptomyces olivoreticuli]